MPRPRTFPPLGLRLTRTSRAVSQAFDQAMVAAGGSAAIWQVLLLVRTRQWSTQSEMAAALGLTGATLTHHLAALEQRGLVRRWREEGNRRSQQVELTAAGEALFDRLRKIAAQHDVRIRAGLSEAEVEQLAGLLERVEAAVREPQE